MNRRLSLLALPLGALLLFAPAALAQQAPDRAEQRIEQRVEALRQAVDLTDDQAAQVRALYERQAAEARAQTGDRSALRSGDRAARRAQMTERRAEHQQAIEAILTPEQVEQYRAWREAQQQERRSRRDGARQDLRDGNSR